MHPKRRTRSRELSRRRTTYYNFMLWGNVCSTPCLRVEICIRPSVDALEEIMLFLFQEALRHQLTKVVRLHSVKGDFFEKEQHRSHEVARSRHPMAW